MPKLLKSVSDWSRSDGVPLHNLVLPWLPHVGLRMDTLLEDARRKLRSMLRSWTVTDGVPDGFIVWKEVRHFDKEISFSLTYNRISRSSRRKNGTRCC